MSEQEHSVDRGQLPSEPAQGDAIGTKTCATCGALIDEYEWFPIRGQTDPEGEFKVYSFCDEACLERWDESAD